MGKWLCLQLNVFIHIFIYSFRVLYSVFVSYVYDSRSFVLITLSF